MKGPATAAEPLLDQVEVEGLFEDLCQGDDQTILTLPPKHAYQVIVFTVSKLAQLWVKLEQRTAA